MPHVVLLTGPAGAGKTTIAKLLTEKNDYHYIDGDHEDTEFFPKGGQRLPENAELLKKAHQKIIDLARGAADEGRNVVIDYIIFDHHADFIASLKGLFDSRFKIVVLMPSYEETVKRDHEREIWTAGENAIQIARQQLEELKGEIGEESYIDTTHFTPEESYQAVTSNALSEIDTNGIHS